MENFNRFNRSGSGGSREFGGRGGDRQMHKTTCSNCGKECEVPFKPTGSKPVFCSECFEKNGGGQSRRFDGARFSEESRRGDRGPRARFEGNRSSERPQNNEQFDALNAKLDKILAILTPTKEELVIQPEETAPVAQKKKSTPGKNTPPSITE